MRKRAARTVINFYKLFQSYIEEIEKAKNDPEALNMFRSHLAKFKKDFDDKMEDTCNEVTSVFKNYKVDIILSYEGEFKTVYDKVSELLSKF